MSRPAAIRWPFADLDRALIHAGYTKRWQKINALGIPGQYPERTWWRWRAEGVPDEAADQVAINLDLHPSLIWPGWNDHPGLDDDDDQPEQLEFVTAPLSDTDIAC